jgi:hypothetical protein
MEWLAHPIVVATYVAVLSLLIGGVRALYQLFHRVGHVEHGVDRLEEKVDDLATDLRAHMNEEGKHIDRLAALIVATRNRDSEGA